jgi:hypothetical protein
MTRTAAVGVGDFGEVVGGAAGCPGYVGFWAARELEAARTASAAKHRDARLMVMEENGLKCPAIPIAVARIRHRYGCQGWVMTPI